MKLKIVMVMMLSLAASFVCNHIVFAQYTGGDGDGYVMASFTGDMGAASPTPTPSPSPTPVPSPSPTPTVIASPTPEATASPTPTPVASPTPSPIATVITSPTPAATATPIATPTPLASPTPTPSPSPTPAPVTATPQVSAGAGHTVALKSDGTVLTWGYNEFGQLGDETTASSGVPAQVKNLGGVIAVAAGENHTVALKSDKTIWSWGSGSYGQLGNGFYADSRIPVQISAFSGVIAAISAGYHTVALGEDGTVWAWGWNWYGQLGDGTTSDSNTPVQVKDFKDVAAVSVGYGHTVALKKDGTVWTWGYNRKGQLGNGTSDEGSHPVPTQVKNLSDVTAIAAGREHTVALKKDGTVWAWGYGSWGQLGDGNTADKSVPVQVIEDIDPTTGKPARYFGDVTAIAGGVNHTVALKKDGTVWAWGYNSNGELGDGSNEQRTIPVQVKDIGNVTAITTKSSHTAALKKDGTVWTWGWNGYGQLGDGGTANSKVPVQASGVNLGGTTATATPTPVASPVVTPEESPTPVASPTPEPSPSPTPPQGEGSVYGSVYDAMDEEPIEGVQVSITGKGGYSNSAKTDGDGYYEILGLAVGKFTLKYKMEGYAVQTQEVEVSEDGEEVEADDVYLEAAQPGTIVGTVVDKAGKGIKSAEVTLKQDGEEVDSTKTGKKGGFEFDDVDAGDYVVEAAIAGYTPASEEVSVLGDGEEVEVELVLSKKGSIIVTVKDGKSNKKIKGASVTLKKETEAIDSGKTDKNGVYTFSNLDGGTYVVEVKMKKYGDASQEVVLGEGEEKKVEIALTK